MDEVYRVVATTTGSGYWGGGRREKPRYVDRFGARKEWEGNLNGNYKVTILRRKIVNLSLEPTKGLKTREEEATR